MATTCRRWTWALVVYVLQKGGEADPVRALPHRLPASRPWFLGADRRSRVAEAAGRADAAADRGYRSHPLPPHFEAAILADLAWLGLRWPLPVWRQSARRAAYDAALGRLVPRLA
jgi:hypothetical protein